MRKPPTVVYLIENLGVGGIETVIWGLMRHIPPERFRILPWFLAVAGPGFEPLRRQFPETHFLDIQTHHRPAGLLRLARELRTAGADLLHAHGYFAGACGRLVAPWLRLPWVYSLYSHYDDTYRARNYLMETVLARSRGTVVACSERVRRFAVERCHIPPAKVVVNYEGVDVPPESSWPARTAMRAAFGLPEDAFVVGGTSRLYPGKNVAMIIQAIALLPAACHLLIAGDGPERPALEQLARALGVAARVHFVGVVTDIARAYRAMDLFVLTSQVREGWSVALVEAMGFAVPVVATAVGANVEAVREDTGWLVPSDDADALARAVRQAMADPQRLRRMGATGRARYLQSWTAAHMAQGFERVYRQLLAPA